MRLNSIVCAFGVAALASAAPVDINLKAATQHDFPKGENFGLPEESILGFIDLAKDKDVSVLQVKEGLLFLNSTVLQNSNIEINGSSIEKRDASPWKWMKFGRGGSYWKRDASPDADADAEPWKWMKFGRGGSYWKRDASPDADADAEPWKWVKFGRGGSYWKRDASPDADADAEPWKWMKFGRGGSYWKREVSIDANIQTGA
ncbi:HER057Cp [Eremothecium sinecaudum]|uniref:HER057Cp n=1 Tax=Eremothecium sinecaudum TaxID=45286 RepID=A0A0X8HTU0_9SACH|nr:HER057Cp [Eremothecium sinecaudum]AMD21336.1 HER057Cp [Eremothecium sinecaudum]